MSYETIWNFFFVSYRLKKCCRSSKVFILRFISDYLRLGWWALLSENLQFNREKKKEKIGLLINEPPRTCGEEVFTSFTSDPRSFVGVLFNLIDSWRKKSDRHQQKTCRKLSCGLSDEKESRRWMFRSSYVLLCDLKNSRKEDVEDGYCVAFLNLVVIYRHSFFQRAMKVKFNLKRLAFNRLSWQLIRESKRLCGLEEMCSEKFQLGKLMRHHISPLTFSYI